MSENKHLAFMVGAIILCSALIIGTVIAHDRGIDQAIVDHLFDFHFDIQEAEQQDRARWEEEKIREAEKQRRHNEFVDEVRGWWRDSDNTSGGSNEGTYTPPENNGNRE